MAKVIPTDDGGLLIYLSSAEVRSSGHQDAVVDLFDVVPVPRPQVTPGPSAPPEPAKPGTGLLSDWESGEGTTTDERIEGDQQFLDDVLKGNA